MRMWMISPKELCDKHLLGEHGEIHKHRHVFVKKWSIAGRLDPVVQIEPVAMKNRHDELAEEMVERGMSHRSPYEMPNLGHLGEEEKRAIVDREVSRGELLRRCKACGKRIRKYLGLTERSKAETSCNKHFWLR